MKYHKDRYDLLNNVSIDITAYNVDNEEEFFALKDEFMNEERLLIQSRVNEERFSGKLE